MELVYLWVEEYKNIKNQGFNFSPRFTCHYNEDKNELTIDENDDYIENFFGDNINVTAIVGKNGSGKSNLIDFLTFLQKGQKQYIVAYIYENEYMYSTNIKELSCGKFKKSSDHYIKINKIIRETHQRPYLHKIKSDYIFNISDNVIMSRIMKDNSNKDPKYYDLILAQESRILQNLINTISKVIFPKNFIVPHEILIYLHHDDKVTIKTLDFFTDFMNTLEHHGIHKNIINEIQRKLYELVNIRNDAGSLCIPIKNNEKHIVKIIEFIENKIFKQENGLRDIILFNFDYELSSGSMQLLKIFSNLDTELLKLDNNFKGGILLLLDEPDIFLHPNWQKQFFQILASFLKYNYKDINFHVLITTHSPFLLSDIPKENIIFLDTYKEKDPEVKEETQEVGNCRVVPHDEVFDKKQTFGQNIHTLLSDSFFMEDGLMGEFAKGKINEIIRFHNLTKKNRHKSCLQKIYDKREKGFRQTQSIVGDPYLQQVLENHLLEIDKFFDKKVAKAKLKARLEKQLAELDND